MIRNYGAVHPGTAAINYRDGISLGRHNEGDRCIDTTIKCNHVSGCANNLYLGHADRAVVTGNIFSRAKYMNMNLEQSSNIIIRGNQINETAAETGSHGLYPSGREGLIISGNIVCGNRNNGIKPRFGGSLSVPVPDKYYSIIGNVCFDNGKNNSGNGIHLQGHSQYMTLMGNSCVNNHNNGIRLQIETETEGHPAAINNVVTGNVAVLHGYREGSQDDPISVEDPSNIEADNLTDRPIN